MHQGLRPPCSTHAACVKRCGAMQVEAINPMEACERFTTARVSSWGMVYLWRMSAQAAWMHRYKTAIRFCRHPQCRYLDIQSCLSQGELDVIIDMINNLDGGRYLDFRILANKPRNVNALQVRGDH